MSTIESLDSYEEKSYLKVAYDTVGKKLSQWPNFGSDKELSDFALHYIAEWKYANDKKTPHTQEQLDKVVKKHLEE